MIIFLDEWLFYALLCWMWTWWMPTALFVAVVMLGASMLVTGYLNLQGLERELGIQQASFLWPIF